MCGVSPLDPAHRFTSGGLGSEDAQVGAAIQRRNEPAPHAEDAEAFARARNQCGGRIEI